MIPFKTIPARWLYIAAIGALLFWIFYGQDLFRQPAPALVVKEYKTDTVYVPRPAPPVILRQPPVAPKTLVVYLPDTTRRQEMERHDLIAGFKVTARQLEVQTISPEGVGKVSVYPLSGTPATEITVNPTGQVNIEVDEKEVRRARRAKNWRKIGNGVITVAAFCLGALAAQQ